jgi:hypothetical protein
MTHNLVWTVYRFKQFVSIRIFCIMRILIRRQACLLNVDPALDKGLFRDKIEKN